MAVLFLVVVVQGLYAGWLNRILYERYAPFYDSMSYSLLWAETLMGARENGVLFGLKAAFHVSTVSLPWLATALFGRFLPVSRIPPVWFQEFWMLLLALSLLWYLHRYRKLPGRIALCCTLPFLSFRAVYEPIGGISDFRLDLMLYALLASMSVWYLTTCETDSWWPWVASGCFLLLACLNRATAPAYLLVIFGPLLAVRLVSERLQARKLILRLLLTWTPAAALAVAALRSNFGNLYYYYFVWGADPNARLPLIPSLLHVLLAGWSIGIPLTVVGMAALFLRLRHDERARWRGGDSIAALIDWKILWIGSAPVVLLVASGAGWNPYVSMPAVFGWLLFCILPFRDDRKWSWSGRRIIPASLVAGSLLNACLGLWAHTKLPVNYASAQGVRKVIDLMLSDARSRGKKDVQFASAHIIENFDATEIRNLLTFDYWAVSRGGRYAVGDTSLSARYENEFRPLVPVTWQELPGDSDDEKLTYLVTLANREVDYFLLPDATTLDYAERVRPHNFINGKAREFQKRLLRAGHWEQVGGDVILSPVETVRVYRRGG